jgi:hypothetical protein
LIHALLLAGAARTLIEWAQTNKTIVGFKAKCIHVIRPR